MKTKLITTALTLFFCFFIFYSNAQTTKEPWTKKQLLHPDTLVKIMNDTWKIKPVIYDIGPSGVIQKAIEIGPTKEKSNLDKLKQSLKKLPKDTYILIYCGCCPFKDCPNIRPAFALLNEMKFTKHQLLDLSTNLKTDWIDKGYPLEK